MSSATQYFVGTASWTDPTLVKSDLFYPSSLKTAEERLKFYAEQFKTVEVDSTYYALPSEKNSKLWAERTPDDFVFNIKAFALLTQHACDTARLPIVIKDMLTERQKSEARLKSPPAPILDKAFQMFRSALGPLRDAGKLGMLLFQFPPYFTCSPRNFDYMAGLGGRFPGDSIAIEFRHPSWVAEPNRADTMKFLREHRLACVSIDAPLAPSIVPSFLELTAPDAYVRFHGRNRENWFRKNIAVAERYKYLYSERELAGWAGRIKQLKGVRRAFAIFNNCYRNFGIMNATTMAHMLNR